MPLLWCNALTLLLAGIPENLATFNIQFGGDTTTTEQVHDTNTNPTTAQLETEAETNKVVELVNNVIDSELELTSSTEGAVDSATDSDYVYEYVYYYYDEDGVNGTVVDTQPASSSVKQVLGQNVTAVDIHTNTGKPPPCNTPPHSCTPQETHPPSTPALLTTQTWRKWMRRRRKRACQSSESPFPPSPSA